MTRQVQKDRERKAVERLRQLYIDFPQHEPEESAEPLDFTVKRDDGSCIGIEVTDFVVGDRAAGSQLDAFQSLTSQISEAATEAYRNLGGSVVFARIHFARDLRCRKVDLPAFAAVIAAEVARAAPTAPTAHYSGQQIYQYDSELPKGVDSVSISQVRSLKESHISTAHAQWASDLLPLHIDEIIESKESKLGDYRVKCPEIWLLIVIHPFRISSFVELSPEVTAATYRTDFDRVLLLYNDARVIELKTN